MTNYLEEYLENTGVLLEQVRQMERSASGVPPAGSQGESEADSRPSAPEYGAPDGQQEEADGLKQRVNRIEDTVDELRLDFTGLDGGPGEAVNRDRETVDKTWASEQAAEEEGGKASGPEAERTNKAKAEQSIPLAVRLEKLDRTAAALAAMVPEGWNGDRLRWEGEGRRGGYPVSLSRAGRGTAWPETAGAAEGSLDHGDGAGGSAPAAGGVMRWAEQADRIFRRDSRRYDGGFYLY